MLAAFLGGIIIARYGFLLYRDGAGTGRDQAGFELGPIRVKAHSVGSIVMATAFLWAWAGVSITPNLERKGEEIRIYSFKTPAGVKIKTQAFTAKAFTESPNSSYEEAMSEVQLTKAFVINTLRKHGDTYIEINGESGSIAPKSVNVRRSPSGRYLLSATVKSLNNSATVVYEPKKQDGHIVFTPIDIEPSNEERMKSTDFKQPGSKILPANGLK